MTKHLAIDSRVLIVSHGYENIYERGFCNGLSDAGIEFLLISSDRTDYKGFRDSAQFLNLRGSQDERRTRLSKALNLLRYHVRLMAYVMTHRHRTIHVIGQIEPPWLTGIVQGLWFRLWCARYVLTVHNLAPHDRETWLNRTLYSLSFRLARTLVVHTAKVRDALQDSSGMRPDKIVVMEHGIEPLSQRDDAPAVPERTPGAVVSLLFFGKVLRYKGIDLLLDALEKVNFPFRLVIAGVSKDGPLTQELTSAIASHPHASAIVWHNRFIEDDEIRPLFEAADVLLLPYRHIDQSGVLFQAFRYGVPVIASDVGSFRDYVFGDSGFICRPNDSGSLKDALQKFHDERSDFSRRRIVDFGRKFEWQNTVRSLGGAYRG